MTSPLLPMDTDAEQPADLHPDIEAVLVSEHQISDKIAELAKQIETDYADREVLLVGVLKGAIMVMADLARALTMPVSMEFMAVSSYGSGSSTSGVVRILKDLDRDIAGKDVLVVEDIIDSGLTLSWLLRNLRSRALKAWAERQVHRAVTAAHVDALRALVDEWHGQGPVSLPGGLVAERRYDRLQLR